MIVSDSCGRVAEWLNAPVLKTGICPEGDRGDAAAII